MLLLSVTSSKSIKTNALLAENNIQNIEDGTVLLDWSDVAGAAVYHVYKSTSFIFSVDALTPIYSTDESKYNEVLVNEGHHYYIIVAENFVENSSISNCEYVEYKIPSLDEFLLISGLVLGSFMLVYVSTRFPTKKSKKN